MLIFYGVLCFWCVANGVRAPVYAEIDLDKGKDGKLVDIRESIASMKSDIESLKHRQKRGKLYDGFWNRTCLPFYEQLKSCSIFRFLCSACNSCLLFQYSFFMLVIVLSIFLRLIAWHLMIVLLILDDAALKNASLVLFCQYAFNIEYLTSIMDVNFLLY